MRINKIVRGLLSHAMDFVRAARHIRVIDAETGEILYKVHPFIFAGILAEVRAQEWECAHVH